MGNETFYGDDLRAPVTGVVLTCDQEFFSFSSVAKKGKTRTSNRNLERFNLIVLFKLMKKPRCDSVLCKVTNKKRLGGAPVLQAGQELQSKLPESPSWICYR